MPSPLFVISSVTRLSGVGDVPAGLGYAAGLGYMARGRIRMRGERGNAGIAVTAVTAVAGVAGVAGAEIMPGSIGIVGIAISVIAVSTTTKRGAWYRVRVMMVTDPGHT
ncbi:hypothetical protein [Candidatus Protofrankia californiensis]|uniref:hypothetical protein n=1 Tax=Candidatus Protofrankia californiensis TaxID=1839754 RepID=UPI0013EDB762|nr:hypothetical protein [Candidatus Protofrankia californiensis]